MTCVILQKCWILKDWNLSQKKFLFLNFFVGIRCIRILETINTISLNSYTIGKMVGHSKKIYVHGPRTFNDVAGRSYMKW